jgi:hypothetical protein
MPYRRKSMLKGHEVYFRWSGLKVVYGYDPTNDGPECETITRILAKHPAYKAGAEKRQTTVRDLFWE